MEYIAPSRSERTFVVRQFDVGEGEIRFGVLQVLSYIR